MIPRVFDTDQHVTPPKDMWTSRMPKRYQDVAPRVVDLEDGTQAWSFDGGAYLHLFGLENVGGKNPADLSWRTTYDDLDLAFYDPKARLAAMDIDGIEATLLFPSVAGHASIIADDGLYVECLRAYNDGIWDWAQAGDPARMYPAALIPCNELESAMSELSRVAKKGFRHFQAILTPGGGAYPSPDDDPFWALAQETGMVVSVHGGARARGGAIVPAPAKGPVKPRPPISQVPIAATRSSGLGAITFLGAVVLTGVLERFPGLKLGLIETSAAWLPSFLERLDATYVQHRWLGEQKLRLLPSEYVRRQASISLDRELQGVKHRDRVGVKSLMFGTDFPHIGSFYPHTRRYVDLLFDAVSEDETHGILWGNAARLYGIG